MSNALQPRVISGVPQTGQFAERGHAYPDVALISVPSAAQWHRLVFDDHLSRGECRDYGRKALEESLNGDDFDVVHTAEQKTSIREESERDDAVDNALDALRATGVNPHQFGAEMARLLAQSQSTRLPAQDTVKTEHRRTA